MTTRSVQKRYTEEGILAILFELHFNLGHSTRVIARDLFDDRVSNATVGRALKGKFPKRQDTREAMRLCTLAPAPVCAKCGEVHVTKRCTSSGDNPRRNRIAVNLADAASAAKALLEHGGKEYALQLAREIERRIG